MPDTTTAQPDGEKDQDVIERLGRALDEWRARLDELQVQLNLAKLDLREEVRARVDITENVYLAARSRLTDLRNDIGSNFGSARRGTEQVLHDLRLAYDAAEDVVRRAKRTS